MHDKLKLLLDKINTPKEYYDYFLNGKILKLKLDHTRRNGIFVIEVEKPLDIEVIKYINENIRIGFPSMESVKASFVIKNKNYDDMIKYYNYVIENSTLTKPMKELFEEKKVSVKNNTLTIELDNIAEENIFKNNMDSVEKLYKKIGFDDFKINLFINEEKKEEIKEQTPKVEIVKEEKKESPIIYGDDVKGSITLIKDIITEEQNITVEAYVFGVEEFESSKSAFKILTFKISDNTDSIYAKFFTKDADSFKKLSKAMKSGWFRINGYVKQDQYAKDLVLNIRNVVKIPSKDNLLKDDADVKRVELHAHTMMSQMDGSTKLDLGKHTCELVTNAINMGYRGVAITDHNGCQAFPIAYGIIKAHNKGIEDKSKHFKGLYGTELTLVDDTVNIVVRKTDESLMDNTYVVFDTETTGFNAAGFDQMIEIGAVKIHKGEIIDRFDKLIDPKRHIPDRITELTQITDAMVSGCDDEKTVTKEFLAWTGDLPMVAHNAKFDISFIEMAMKKYDLGEFKNTVIDTLELSRALDQGYARHSLSALVKRYNVPWDEEAHHRADYDAEGTALVFDKFLQKLNAQNYEKISDLDRLIKKDEIHKFGRTFHFNAIALNKTGLKNIFKMISLANTVYLYKTPRILRSEVERLREGVLIGSGCYESEVFIEARSKEGEELSNIINFYDYVEVQPPEVYNHLIQMGDFKDEKELENHIRKIINAVKSAGKLIVATGDVHHFRREDKVYREIIVNQKVPGGGRHPLAKKDIKEIPSQHFRTTDEMLNDFAFLGKELAYEIVVTNTNKVLDMADEVEVIIDTKGIPFSPRVKSDDGKSYLDCPRVVTDLVYEKAKDWYGDPLPLNIEERIATELYGNIVFNVCLENVKEEHKDLAEEDQTNMAYSKLHEVILKGFDAVKDLLRTYFKNNWTDDEELTDDALEKKVKKELGGIIGGGFDPIYLIAQRLVKHSNDEGYLVGSRGSVGSSFVATMMGITEVNPLPAHYRCLKCKHSLFNFDDGKPLGSVYSTGFDLPDKKCPVCGEKMYKDGQDMPFATFLGFNADKVPDIDLNFSDLNQASAHAYTKVLFGPDNVYRAGTIGTVAEKTAYGFVKGYLEDKEINKRPAEIERLALGCTGVKRTTGQHPGGIVVIPDYMEVFDFTPFQFPADDPTSAWRTTHFDYHAIDECVLKLDILGHSDPTQLRMIQDITKTDITKVPLDDKDTMSIFTSTKALGVTNEQIMCKTGTLGIPEFGTNFTISLVYETKPTTFAELIKISGLSHGTDVWLGNAQELIKNNIVPFKDVIGCRDDIMVYLMYHGVEPIKAFKIMEFVRKGRASKDPETWKTHIKTMEDANIPDWFINSCGKIKYMFPKAHAAAYVISAFRIAWYKVHMPVAFYASWLTSKATDVDVEVMIRGYDAIKEKIIEIQNKGFDASNKETGQLESLRVSLEATARKIKFLPVDLYESEATTWRVKDDNSIYPPFNAIDGLGDTVAKKIVEERQKNPFISIEDLQSRAKVSQTLIDKMRLMGILEALPESSQLSLF
ncbi:MAG TPA: PolC-type DNA polymerase III [Candidatus Aphodocola excrementigallinarum]|uniref:DNA polymerase III PolC-type n=1 Tax=Candidatus Aphodocola excrementigallinarum TaxID=2840670 RepID=A0A9D1INX1_9FIRM|nr:PolC-type DNA polymerase III [Candidatus Aphodocola excrementigallinarum]